MISSHSSAVGAGIGHEVEPQTIAMCSNSVARSDALTSRSGKPSYSGDASIGDCIPHPSLLACSDDSKRTALTKEVSTDTALRAPAATGPREPVGPRASSSLRAGWRRLVEVCDRIEDSWVGDLIGAVCLFATFYILIVIAGVLQ